MNVLVDRHQADLFYSLQRLFEDRLGHTVYTPIGHEWWDEGIWNFGRGTYPDDRLAQQYLAKAPWNETDFIRGRWHLYDGHHPDRVIQGIEHIAAREMDWGYVVATVQDNQQGFRKFADEVGARYVLQVGNTGQWVDWSLDPLALVSSEVPIKGRGILYHQEFDAEGTFGYTEPDPQSRVIRSFVNCLPETICYPRWKEMQAALPEFTFGEHGIGGADGIVAPVSAIADLMRGSAFGWHDKPHGDGFGHVIHDWAAIGRPLIGHSGHYRGLMAEPFWQDGVTCIDLDRHSVTEAAGLVREITADAARHKAMCQAIRATFDGLVDFDAEAERIAEFLA